MGVKLTESNYLFRVDFIKSYAQSENGIISPIQLRSQLISLSLRMESVHDNIRIGVSVSWGWAEQTHYYFTNDFVWYHFTI